MHLAGLMSCGMNRLVLTLWISVESVRLMQASPFQLAVTISKHDL